MGARNAVSWTAAGLAATAVLLAPALWNGFPLIYPDTGGYLERPFLGTLELGRSALYGIFLAAGMALDFWPNVALQAALMAWLITLTLRAYAGARPWLALGVIVLLAGATSLPLYASQLMPDVMFPAAVLALNLVVFRSADLTRAERLGLGAVVALAIAVHMAVLALALGILASLVLLASLRRNALPKPRLGAATFAVAAGIALCPITNAAVTGQFAFTPGGTNFLFQRLIEDGLVTRYLDEKCPDPTLRICSYRAEISEGLDDWLWKSGSPFWKLGGWQGHSDEERRIIVGTLARYPFTHIATAAAAAATQFFTFASEIVTSPWDNARAVETLVRLAPGLTPRLMAARQQARPSDTLAINDVHVPFAALSLVGLLVIALFGARLGIGRDARAFCLMILTALAVNAAVCGIFSHPSDRYQSRLIPLASLAIIVALFTRRQDRPWTAGL